MNWGKLGQIAYEKYKSLLTVAGHKLDTWEDLDPVIKNIWIEVALTICNAFVEMPE